MDVAGGNLVSRCESASSEQQGSSLERCGCSQIRAGRHQEELVLGIYVYRHICTHGFLCTPIFPCSVSSEE
jgi:hypothetical protein